MNGVNSRTGAKQQQKKANQNFRDNEQRGSFYKSHQDYFQKLQKQLIHKSNFYAGVIGQTMVNKSYKWSESAKKSDSKVQKQSSFEQEHHNNIQFVQHRSKRQSTVFDLYNCSKQNKRAIFGDDEMSVNNSLQNLHNKYIMKNPIRFQQKKQSSKDQITMKHQHKTHLKSNIQRIKQILKYSSSPVKNQFFINKTKNNQQTKISSELQLERNFAYNFTFQNNCSSFLQDSPEKKQLRNNKSRQKRPKNISKLLVCNNQQQEMFKNKKLKNKDKNKLKTNNQIQQNNLIKKQDNGKQKRSDEEFIPTNFKNKFLQKSSEENMEETITTKTSLFSSQNESKNNVFLRQQKAIERPSHVSNQPNKKKVTMTFRPQKLNINQFVILGLLGQGKVGKVYVAKHLKTNFLCAIKIIQKQLLNEAIFLQLIRQVKIQTFLDHPNIVQLYSFFSDEKYIYLMLQLCFSGNLYTCLRRQGKLQEEKVRTIIKQVCNGLQYMHDNDILHRDLKPQNIVFHQQVIKLCDFGWSIHSNLLRDTLCGTPIYSCPQIIQKKKYDNKIDIWNVGILTYQLLIGRVPFQIRFEQDLRKIVHQNIYFPKSCEISDQGKHFMINCLNRNRYKRFSIIQLIDHPFIANQ